MATGVQLALFKDKSREARRSRWRQLIGSNDDSITHTHTVAPGYPPSDYDDPPPSAAGVAGAESGKWTRVARGSPAGRLGSMAPISPRVAIPIIH